jgi:hypothetical protein
MPPKPTMPTSRVRITCGRRSAPSSPRTVASGRPGDDGTTARTAAAVSAARTVTVQYADRQPNCWPSQVAAGTPVSIAADRPRITELTARPRRCGATREAATREATPKYAPCGRPLRNRATSRVL